MTSRLGSRSACTLAAKTVARVGQTSSRVRTDPDTLFGCGEPEI